MTVHYQKNNRWGKTLTTDYTDIRDGSVQSVVRYLFVVVGFTQTEVGQLAEGGHAAACL